MNYATALLENRYPIESSELEKFGLRKGDWVEFFPLPVYFPGDVVLIVAQGKHKIGQVLSQQPLKIFAPTACPQIQEVLPLAVVGVVAIVNDDDDAAEPLTQTCSTPAGR
ncbi:MAG TPA: hypothetical protein PLD20_12990 [Blastocatellia bacterium]|nr:hypothetical protein [Blastocatellia bacterium]HMV87199.1 hypothetical protein [Blastocatellia bacterium]HMX25553.1 hypothetical protein [Blastocatellia bacterium]HMY70287.1 hypothetical protein [Blastocatellia bacterium]HMZ18844.1 hypothetical protein [Blastocatellia bacterium]